MIKSNNLANMASNGSKKQSETVNSLKVDFVSKISQGRIDPDQALAVAQFVRNNSTTKCKEGLLGGKRVTYFRVKRAIRVLLDHKAKRPKPIAANEEEAVELLRQLTLRRLIVRVDKHPATLAVQRTKPVTLTLNSRQNYEPNDHFVLLYEPKNYLAIFYSVLIIAFALTCVMYPLWPASMKHGARYLSLGAIGLILLFFALAVVRLVLFIITALVVSPGLWLFPNLFADCGVIDSFKPLWSWHSTNSKNKEGLKSSKRSGSSPLGKKSGSSQPSHDVAVDASANIEEIESKIRRRNVKLEDADSS